MNTLSITSDSDRTSVTRPTPSESLIDRGLAETRVTGTPTSRRIYIYRIYRSDSQRSASGVVAALEFPFPLTLLEFNLLPIALLLEKATKDNNTPYHGKPAPRPDLLAPTLGPLARLEDLQAADEAKALLEKIQAALPHLPRAAVVVGEEGAYLLEWTVGRRRVGISIEKNPSESGWYHVSLDPAAPGSGSGSMKDLDIRQLFARLFG
ncbi:MAG: hypothetical protein ACR2M4_09035 [Actinomycetota bacterium]